MKKLLSTLNGNKTYLGVIAAGILGLLISFGVVQYDDVEWLVVLIGTWTGVGIVHKAGKIETAVKRNGVGS